VCTQALFFFILRLWSYDDGIRILRPPSTDTRPSSRRTNGSTIPPFATQSLTQPSPTLLYPTFDSSSIASSSTSLPSPSSSPTLPSSSSFTASSKHLSPTLNNDRIVLATHDDSDVPSLMTTSAGEVASIGPSLRRHDDDAPPAYEKCVTGVERLESV
jgi:hypothetical protein